MWRCAAPAPTRCASPLPSGIMAETTASPTPSTPSPTLRALDELMARDVIEGTAFAQKRPPTCATANPPTRRTPKTPRSGFPSGESADSIARESLDFAGESLDFAGESPDSRSVSLDSAGRVAGSGRGSGVAGQARGCGPCVALGGITQSRYLVSPRSAWRRSCTGRLVRRQPRGPRPVALASFVGVHGEQLQQVAASGRASVVELLAPVRQASASATTGSICTAELVFWRARS